MSIEHEYAFGQWVIGNDGIKYRYLGVDSDGDALLLDTDPDTMDTEYVRMPDIRPDPDPPELVPGQLVMVKIDDKAEWQGPYEYIGCNAIMKYKHIADNGGLHTPTISQYAKPYIPSETPESERPTTEQRLDSLEKRITELVTHIQTLKNTTQ